MHLVLLTGAHGPVPLAREAGVERHQRYLRQWDGLAFLAADYSSADMVEAVIKAGGDVHSRTIDGWIPLHSAARRGNPQAVRLLVGAGSDPASRGE